MTPTGASELFRANGLPLDEAAIGTLLEYERLLLAWNEKINLVSRKDTAEVFRKQIVGSISFLFSYRLEPGAALLDVGTGGGLPGIPVAIIHPDIAVTMVDSIRKKMTAVGDMVGALRLPNARTICSRVEELDPSKIGRFDYIVARGVSSASDILGWCAKLLRVRRVQGPAGSATGQGPRALVPPGSLIFLKGGDLEGELAQLSEVAGRASVTVRSLTVAGAEALFTDKKVIIVTP